MNAFDPALFAASINCLPCCNQPAECACALLIPPFGLPAFSDYAAAAAALAANVAGCYLYYFPGDAVGTLVSLSAAFDGATLTGTVVSMRDGGPSPVLMVKVTGLAGKTISWAYTSSATSGGFVGSSLLLYDCNFGYITQADGSSASETLTVTLPADGGYYLYFNLGWAGGAATALTVNNTVTCDGVCTCDPVIALWDDSGTTRQLEACPKLLLPPLTESTGDWYADCAAAAAVLTDPLQVSNCIGYCAPEYGSTDFSASGGSSPSFTVTNGSGGMAVYFSVNAAAGDVLTFTWTGDRVGILEVYDDAGVLVSSDIQYPGPATSVALPYSGKYTIRAALLAADMSTSYSGAISSSGAMTTNPPQALYDIGLDCPARLDCGDSCP